MRKTREIEILIEVSNKQFEYLEYSRSFITNNEFLSLKISINNLLKAIYDYEQTNKQADDQDFKLYFYQMIFLSSPILFDFIYNDNVLNANRLLKNKFVSLPKYEESKKWYKFVRNSLVHTNRYTLNNFTDKIYKVEYNQVITIHFELRQKAMKSFGKFMNNQFVHLNEGYIAKENIKNKKEIKALDIKFSISYQYLIIFIKREIDIFIEYLEKEVDNLFQKDLQKWKNYYIQYESVIKYIIQYKEININQIVTLQKSIKKIKDFSFEHLYILVEYLEYLKTISYQINISDLQYILDITCVDPFAQIDNRQLLLMQLNKNKQIPKYKVNFSNVLDLLNQIQKVSTQQESQIQSLYHTNFLIVYTEKYLQSKENSNKEFHETEI